MLLQNESGQSIVIKIDDYQGSVTDYSDPQKFFGTLENLHPGFTVQDYVIKAGNEQSGDGFFSPDGTLYNGDTIPSWSSGMLVGNSDVYEGNAFGGRGLEKAYDYTELSEHADAVGFVGVEILAFELSDHDDGNEEDLEPSDPDAGRESLQLIDLLQEANENELGGFLFFAGDGQGNTVAYINAEGGFSGYNYEGEADQAITLEGVSYAETSYAELVTQLLDSEQLNIDT